MQKCVCVCVCVCICVYIHVCVYKHNHNQLCAHTWMHASMYLSIDWSANNYFRNRVHHWKHFENQHFCYKLRYYIKKSIVFAFNKALFLEKIIVSFYLLIFGCAGSLLLCGLSSSCSRCRLLIWWLLLLSRGPQACWLRQLQCVGSVVAVLGSGVAVLGSVVAVLGSGVQLHQLWCRSSVAPRHMGSSQIRDQTWVSRVDCQVDSLPRSHQGSPLYFKLYFCPHFLFTFKS